MDSKKPEERTQPEDLIKFLLGLIFITIFRILCIVPNVQPLLSTQMPFSKKYGALAGALFGSTAIVAFDVLAGQVGLWTLVTSGTYVCLGLAAAHYFSRKSNKVRHYAVFSIFGTLFFDFTTGPIAGTFLFGQSFIHSVTAQIPFTLYHLAGNLFFAVTLSPLVYRWIIKNHKYHPARLI